MTCPAPQRIASLESVRGLLALWVVIGHCLDNCGISESQLGPFATILRPSLAVDVFIILSGFVISHLLVQGISYRPFIIRRFFRLAPLYFIVLGISAATIHWQYDLMSSLPWRTPTVMNNTRIIHDTIAAYPRQLLAHLTMLHGVFPLPNSDYAFVAPAWSISVEWQFYLVAPVVIGMALTRRWAALGAFALMICIVRAAGYGGQGFAPNQAPFFAIGILSYFAWARLRLEAGQRYLIAALGIALPYLLLQRWVSCAAWGIALASILRSSGDDDSLAVIRNALGLRPLLWLGQISYSVYLTHILVLMAVMSAFRDAAPAATGWEFALPVTLVTAVCTIVIATMTHTFIEVPGIAMGRRLTTVRDRVALAES